MNIGHMGQNTTYQISKTLFRLIDVPKIKGFIIASTNTLTDHPSQAKDFKKNESKANL